MNLGRVWAVYVPILLIVGLVAAVATGAGQQVELAFATAATAWIACTLIDAVVLPLRGEAA